MKTLSTCPTMFRLPARGCPWLTGRRSFPRFGPDPRFQLCPQSESSAHFPCMLIGIAAHADCPIRQIAEYTASIFPGNGRLPPAAYRVAQFRALERIGFRLLYRDPQRGVRIVCPITLKRLTRRGKHYTIEENPLHYSVDMEDIMAKDWLDSGNIDWADYDMEEDEILSHPGSGSSRNGLVQQLSEQRGQQDGLCTHSGHPFVM